jgi:serine/threonine protein kinase/tetratricopeptide (TPR) repeat protein
MALPRGSRLGPYEILAPLGAGGMGEVYRARDGRLDRDVAIKVLPERFLADPDALARFEREAKAVAALSHPNILAIHDFGTDGGIAYAVTELLEGETLRAKLDGGPIPRHRAVEYGLQIARGLSAAHDKRLIHRDLKPENLFVTKAGHLKILDFGLAKRIERVHAGKETGASTVSGQTEPGTVMGTLGYMSPEQVKGLPVDHRTDIFSFGAVLYEMLSGQKAFGRRTANETIAAILKEEPPDVADSGRKIPVALDHVVRHCLEKDADARFQTARDVAFNLSEQSTPVVTGGDQSAEPQSRKRRIWIAAAIAAVVAASVANVFVSRRSSSGSSSARAPKRVAVLPFENLGSPGDDYFVDGISDAVRGKLTSVPGIEVIARTSSIAYKKTSKSPKNISDELQAPYLLTATVRWQKSGTRSRVQVTPELVEVMGSRAPSSRWEQPFDAPLIDVFQVQSDIATRVARELGVAFGAGEVERLSEKPTQNLAAYDAFLKGEEMFHSTGDMPRVRNSIQLYEQAVALDPQFFLAWARVSFDNSVLYFKSVAPAHASRALEAARKAISLRPDRWEGYFALGMYEDSVRQDFAAAQKEYDRAFRLAPVNAETLNTMASIEQRLGQWDAALRHFREAYRLDPRSVENVGGLAVSLQFLRRYPEAREVFDRGLEFAPADFGLIEGKAETFLAQGDLEKAKEVLRAATKYVKPVELVAYLADVDDLVWVLDEQQMEILLRLTPDAFDSNGSTSGRWQWAFSLAEACALRGDVDGSHHYAEEARRILAEQLTTIPGDAQRHAYLGLALAYLGRKTEAIREGQRAVALVTKDGFQGHYQQLHLVQIYTLAGEYQKALDNLELLLKIPGILSPGWLRIDPNFDPLRKNPRFQRLVAEK